jgi:hypothetical protein
MKNKAKTWYAVKCIFVYDDGDFETLYQYEERITLWFTSNADNAIELAEKEAKKYAKKTRCKYTDFCESCLLYERPEHGKEVYSIFREADIEPQHYLDEYYDTGSEIIDMNEKITELDNLLDYKRVLEKATINNNKKLEKILNKLGRAN